VLAVAVQDQLGDRLGGGCHPSPKDLEKAQLEPAVRTNQARRLVDGKDHVGVRASSSAAPSPRLHQFEHALVGLIHRTERKVGLGDRSETIPWIIIHRIFVVSSGSSVSVTCSVATAATTSAADGYQPRGIGEALVDKSDRGLVRPAHHQDAVVLRIVKSQRR